MSWIISNALMKDYENSHCSQVQAVESSEVTCSDGKQSAPLNGTNTPLLYCAQDKMKGFSRISRSGMTCRLLTEVHGEDLLTWYLEASRARTYQAQAVEQESKENDQECGSTWRESLAKYDPDSHSWRTAQCSLLGGLESFSETWPRSGTMRNGVAYPARNLEPTTSATESGLLPKMPTPRASDGKGAQSKDAAQRARDRGFAPNLPELIAELEGGGALNPMYSEWMMGWPSGWTDLKPLETDRFQQWQQAHSFS